MEPITEHELILASEAPSQEDRVPQWLLDLLLGIVVTLVIALAISADQGGQQDPDAVAYLMAGGFGVLMLARRRFPVGVLVLTMFLLFAYYTLNYPVIGLAVPIAAALYSAAELGHLTAAIVVSFIVIVVSTYFRVLGGEPIAYLLGYELVSTMTLMAAAIALGDNARSRRALRAEQAQTARLIAQEHAYRAERRVQAERVRMARDLHDVIGHSISVISLHADVAREAIGSDDEAARQALTQIRATSSETMRELRATVKLLRQPAAVPDRSISSLTNLSPLIDSVEAGGLAVDVQIEGGLTDLPGAVDTAVYRIIQEAFTNILRHAKATRVTLKIEVDDQELHLQIHDNGTMPVTTVTAGSGIVGMSERASLLGGTLTAQPLVQGGFVVEARLPLEEAA